MYRYAQIDNRGMLICITDFNEKINLPDMILLDGSFCPSTGMIYDKEKNSWEEAPEEPEPPKVKSVEERLDSLDQMIMATMSAVVELGLKGGEF